MEGSSNPYEDVWVQQALAASVLDTSGDDSRRGAPVLGTVGAAGAAAPPSALWGFPFSGGFGFQSASHLEEEQLRQAIAESAAQTQGSSTPPRHYDLAKDQSDEDADLQRALRESAGIAADAEIHARPLLGLEGPFAPAGLLNSGNSCFWNALVQALFAATPVFRGALFQLSIANNGSDKASSVLGMLRDLFAEMDMGLAGAIDAGDLYRTLFKRAEEADVSEQMQRLFDLATSGPGPLKAVWQELFSGDMYERQRSGPVRRVPLDFCQLDLCVGDVAAGESPCSSLETLLEAHTRDVQGNISGRSYRLPPVLWVNLDRFVYDRVAQCGRKRHARLTFPDVLNAWMLVPPDEPWVQALRQSAAQMQDLQKQLDKSRSELARERTPEERAHESFEEAMLKLVEQQEALLVAAERIEAAMACQGAEQELLYRLQAVIVHSGRVETGHYYSYARAPPCKGNLCSWVCLNDSSVAVCSADEMRSKCEGTTDKVDRPSLDVGRNDPVRPAPVDTLPADDAQIERDVIAEIPAPGTDASNKRPASPDQPVRDELLEAIPVESVSDQAPLHQRQSPPQTPEHLGHSAVSGQSPDTRARRVVWPSASRNHGPRASSSIAASSVVNPTPKAKSASSGVWHSVSSMLGCWVTKAEADEIIVQAEEATDHRETPTVPLGSLPSGEVRLTPEHGVQSESQQQQLGDDTDRLHQNLQHQGQQQVQQLQGHRPAKETPPRREKPPSGAVRTQPNVHMGSPSSSQAEVNASENFTAARCLVYVRCGIGDDDRASLLTAEVRQRVAPALQETIDAKNLTFLHKCAGKVAEDFVACIRQLSSGGGEQDLAEVLVRDSLREALRAAERVRLEGGMGRARMFLLRACWRLHIPWLPEELCPTAQPPDFRMHYGVAAKRALLDALIRLGQHDVASLIVAGAAQPEAFIPADVTLWLAKRGLQ